VITVLPSIVCLVVNLHYIIIIIIIIILLALQTFVGFGFLNKVIPNLPIQHHFFPLATFITIYVNVTVLFTITFKSWPIRAMDWWHRFQFSVGARNFSLVQNSNAGFGSHPGSCSLDTGGSFPGNKSVGA